MTAIALVRVGIDQAFGGWNAPVDPVTGDFVYVPIPESEPFGPGLSTPYSQVLPALAHFAAARQDANPKHVTLPRTLVASGMHLDPDFGNLTYGDNGLRRGSGIAEFERGDVLVFYAGLRPVPPSEQRLIYAIIGFYRVADVERAGDVANARWGENAHTRRLRPTPTDIIVRAEPGESGRLRRCIPIGELRDKSYRVRRDLLAQWGGLSCKDGFIQRSAVPPMVNDPAGFMRWFERQKPDLIAENNPFGRITQGFRAVANQPRPDFAAIVADYRKHYQSGAKAELAWYARQPTLAAAVRRACLGLNVDGKRHSHQRRIVPGAIAAAGDRLAHSLSRIARAPNFDSLHRLIADLLSPIPGIGELYLYDTALRIGAKLGLQPTTIYLHRGTREGARAIGFSGKLAHIHLRDLPPAFRSLQPYEVEDVLCIYKDQLRGGGIHGGGGGCASRRVPIENVRCG